MAIEKPIMFDKDVAALLGLSTRTLQRRLAKPVSGEINLNDAKPVTIGSRRIWLRRSVMALLGFKEGTK